MDSSAALGSAGRLEGRAAGGDSELRGYVALATGGGFLAQDQAGYGLLSAEAGFELGDGQRYGGGLLYGARICEIDTCGALHGLGAGLWYLTRLTRPRGEGSALFLGPRLQIERLWGSSTAPSRTLFSLALELRWLLMDTT